MNQDQSQQQLQQEPTFGLPPRIVEFLARLRAYLATLPDIRLAYYQPGPSAEQLVLTGPDRAQLIPVFMRSVSPELVKKRIAKIRRHFAPLVAGLVDFVDVESLNHRAACEIAFNAQVVYGSLEAVERDRLYRYNQFLDWNAGKKFSGTRQDQPPALTPPPHRPAEVVDIRAFVLPIYRHLKLIDRQLREMKQWTSMEMNAFTADTSNKTQAESVMLKGIQSSILITMSVIHRRIRLSARDYRDLFLLLPVYGITPRERAAKLAKCADIRDRLMFEYSEISAVEVYQHLFEVADTLRDFKGFMLEWLFDHYYSASGELINAE
ncbi:MAG: HepT-like ribonuclease domain-containing protein [Armatimonadota bacterium]